MVTVRVVDPIIPETGSVAEIVVVPTATDVASPLYPAALLISATPLSDESHVTDVLRRGRVDPSVKLPMAVKSLVPPLGMVELAGFKVMDANWASVTVSVAEIARPVAAWVAVTVAVPTPTAVAMPFEPAALLTAATVVSEEDQVTDSVISFEEPSVYVPATLNCMLNPLAML